MRKSFEQPNIGGEQEKERAIERKEELLELARELFEDDDLAYVEGLLDDGKIMGARMRMLATLDYDFMKGRIGFDDAHDKYKILGFTPDEAARIRQTGGGFYPKEQ